MGMTWVGGLPNGSFYDQGSEDQAEGLSRGMRIGSFVYGDYGLNIA